MRRSIVCSRCGATNDYRSRRCVECGWRFVRAQDDILGRTRTVFGVPFTPGCLPFVIIVIVLSVFLIFGRLWIP